MKHKPYHTAFEAFPTVRLGLSKKYLQAPPLAWHSSKGIWERIFFIF
jgi:hypothetical protein